MKNSKIYKKFLSMLTAGVIFATPIAANASSTKNEKEDTSFSLRSQNVELTPLNINDYTINIEKAYNYLCQFINYDGLQLDLQCLYYLINREYMVKDDEKELIDLGIIYSTDVVNGKFENFARAYNLINVINDYNQSAVRNKKKMIDPSMLCYNYLDKDLVYKMFNNYFIAYQEVINEHEITEKDRPLLIENIDYQMVFKQLTTLNAAEKAGNAHELSIGARWGSAENIIGGEVMQLMRDYMQKYYSRAELDKYFVKEELNKGQWILRKDISLDLNCLQNELEVLVFQFGQLWTFVYDHVNDDIMRSFTIECNKTK